MSDPMDHYLFSWRPEIRRRVEAQVAEEMVETIGSGLDMLAPGDADAARPMEAMRDALLAALIEWNARPWWVRVVGRTKVNDDAVTMRRWMEHAMGFSQALANRGRR